ncbi:hypothetical protein [Pseudomonas sp. 1152_12]|uniref:hypothetical protein n=1 Tax=Pseudomonas sp. 1152_12 TaxID=2604455 RepID=UPI0040642C23
MRYLKITAQDDYDNDVIDAVYLEFFDGVNAKAVAEALVMNTQEHDHGSLKWVLAEDINGNGVSNTVDSALARALARSFLKFQWWKVDQPFNRYLEVLAEDLDLDGKPDLVRLRFHEGEGAPTDETLVEAAACVFLNDPAGRYVTLNADVNGDWKTDPWDTTLVVDMARLFLKCDWNNAHVAKPCTFTPVTL